MYGAVLIEEEMPVDVMGLNCPSALRILPADKARLTIYGGIENAELYDLENDPNELDNLFDKPEGQRLRVEMMERLARTMLEYSDQGTLPQV